MAGPFDTPQTFWDKVRDLFGKPSIQLPTPNVDDYIVVQVETKGSDTPWKLPYGTRHSTLVDQTGEPLVLVKQSRSPGTQEGQFVVTRMYVNNRINQGSYNYSLSWALNSKAHVIVSRSSLVLRSTYVTTATVNGQTQVTVNATPNFTPDATFSSALLVSETAALAEAPYDTLYLRVTQTFETIAGPVLTGQEFTKIGRTVTLIPPEFLGNQQLFLSSQVVLPGTAADPQDSIDALGHIVVSSIVTAIDATHSQKVNIARANVPYPTLFNAELESDFGGAVASTSRSIVASGTPPTNSFLTLASSEKAISGTETLQETTTVTGFPVLYGVEYKSNYPEEFLANLDVETTEDWVDTTTAAAASYLDTGLLVVGCTVVPQTALRAKRTVRSLPAGTALPTLVSHSLAGDFGDAPAGETRQIVAEGTAVPQGFGVVSAAQEAISDTEEVQRVVNVTTFPVLPGAEYQVAIPEKFLAGINLATVIDWVDITSAPSASYLQSGAGILSCSIVAESIYRAKRVTRSLPAGAALPTFKSTTRNERGQYVTTVESIDDGSTPLAALTALSADPTSLTPLGGGNFLRTVSTLSDVFAGTEYTAEIPITVPEAFRARALTTTVGVTAAGTAAPPTLAAGQFKVSVREVDEQTVRTETTALNLAALPLELTDTRLATESIFVTRTRILGLSGTQQAAPGGLVLSDAVEDLGSGISLRTTETATGFAVVPGQTSEQSLNGIALPYTEQIMPVAQAQSLVGQPYVTITQMDEQRVRVRTYTPAAIQAELLNFSRVYYTKTNVQFPSELQSLAIIWNTAQGEGSYVENGTAQLNGEGSLQLNVSNDSQGSASVIPEIAMKIFTPNGEALDVADYYFFVLDNTTRAAILARVGTLAGTAVNPWPRWCPTEDTLVLSGQKASLQAKASVRFSLSDNNSSSSTAGSSSLGESSGQGLSQDFAITQHAVNLPRSIHPVLAISGNTQVAVQASASTTATIAGVGLSASAAGTLIARGSVGGSSLTTTTGGGGATGTATVANGALLYGVVTANGSGYTSNPAVTIVDPTGTGGAVTAIAAPYAVSAATVTNAGSKYDGLGGGSGTGGSGSAGFRSDLSSFIAIDPPLGSTGTDAIVEAIVSNGMVQSVAIVNGGSGYTGGAPNITIAAPSSGGTQATAVATVTGGQITGLTITSPGTGYTNPTLEFSGGGGSGAAGSITARSGFLTGITVGNGGSGYPNATQVQIDDPTGSGALATATATAGVITSVTLSAAGINYTAPVVTFLGGSSVLAALAATAGASTIPTSGTYLLELTPGESMYGCTAYRARTLDMSQLTVPTS